MPHTDSGRNYNKYAKQKHSFIIRNSAAMEKLFNSNENMKSTFKSFVFVPCGLLLDYPLHMLPFGKAKCGLIDLEMVKEVQKYVPGYRLKNGPVFDGKRVSIFLEVEGLGDYLPKYAGNLDIMTAAALHTAEVFAAEMLEKSGQQTPVNVNAGE